MSATRSKVFDDADDIDLSGFTPTKERKPKAPAGKVRATSEAAKFVSRQAKPAAPAPVVEQPAATPLAKREPRRHRTGRTAQLNVRVKPEAMEAFYTIADAEGWLIGETVEKALDALQRELKRER